MTRLSPNKFAEMFAAASSSLFRLETRRQYVVPDEQPLFDAWKNGHPIEPPSVSWYNMWLDDVATRTQAGFVVQRVRIVETPPTCYQAYNAWAGQWNAAAGEDIRYLDQTVAQAAAVTDDRDWWMFDGRVVVDLVFDDDDRLARYELADPSLLDNYLALRERVLDLISAERDAS